jgi:DNA modification methylase
MSDREYFTPKILQGDVLARLKNQPSDWFDLICIDPPYNMNKADWDSFGNGHEFAQWARPWLQQCQRILNDSGSIYIFGLNRMLSHIQEVLDELGFVYQNWIIWDTIQGAGGGLWVNRYEAILYYSKTDHPVENAEAVKLERHEENIREYKGKEYAFKNPSNIWRFPCVDDKHPERTGHPTQKPVELIERIVLASSPVEGHVMDCFMGSGTTGVACMKHRRRCVGIEQDAGYIDMAQARFATTEIGV